MRSSREDGAHTRHWCAQDVSRVPCRAALGRSTTFSPCNRLCPWLVCRPPSIASVEASVSFVANGFRRREFSHASSSRAFTSRGSPVCQWPGVPDGVVRADDRRHCWTCHRHQRRGTARGHSHTGERGHSRPSNDSHQRHGRLPLYAAAYRHVHREDRNARVPNPDRPRGAHERRPHADRWAALGGQCVRVRHGHRRVATAADRHLDAQFPRQRAGGPGSAGERAQFHAARATSPRGHRRRGQRDQQRQPAGRSASDLVGVNQRGERESQQPDDRWHGQQRTLYRNGGRQTVDGCDRGSPRADESVLSRGRPRQRRHHQHPDQVRE